MSVLVYSQDGRFVKKTDLATASTATDCAGKTVVVTSPQILTTSFAWPDDRVLKFEEGGYIAGEHLVTNLPETRPEWFGVVTGTDDNLLVDRSIAACKVGGTVTSKKPRLYCSATIQTGKPLKLLFPDTQFLIQHDGIGVDLSPNGTTFKQFGLDAFDDLSGTYNPPIEADLAVIKTSNYMASGSIGVQITNSADGKFNLRTVFGFYRNILMRAYSYDDVGAGYYCNYNTVYLGKIQYHYYGIELRRSYQPTQVNAYYNDVNENNFYGGSFGYRAWPTNISQGFYADGTEVFGSRSDGSAHIYINGISSLLTQRNKFHEPSLEGNHDSAIIIGALDWAEQGVTQPYITAGQNYLIRPRIEMPYARRKLILAGRDNYIDSTGFTLYVDPRSSVPPLYTTDNPATREEILRYDITDTGLCNIIDITGPMQATSTGPILERAVTRYVGGTVFTYTGVQNNQALYQSADGWLPLTTHPQIPLGYLPSVTVESVSHLLTLNISDGRLFICTPDEAITSITLSIGAEDLTKAIGMPIVVVFTQAGGYSISGWDDYFDLGDYPNPIARSGGVDVYSFKNIGGVFRCIGHNSSGDSAPLSTTYENIKAITGASVNLLETPVASMGSCSGVIDYSVTSTDGTDIITNTGSVKVSAVNTISASPTTLIYGSNFSLSYWTLSGATVTGTNQINFPSEGTQIYRTVPSVTNGATIRFVARMWATGANIGKTIGFRFFDNNSAYSSDITLTAEPTDYIYEVLHDVAGDINCYIRRNTGNTAEAVMVDWFLVQELPIGATGSLTTEYSAVSEVSAASGSGTMSVAITQDTAAWDDSRVVVKLTPTFGGGFTPTSTSATVRAVFLDRREIVDSITAVDVTP